MEDFNKEDVHNRLIEPLVNLLIEICNEHRIPMLTSFTIGHSQEKGPHRCTTLLDGFMEKLDDSNRKACRVLVGTDVLKAHIIKSNRESQDERSW